MNGHSLEARWGSKTAATFPVCTKRKGNVTPQWSAWCIYSKGVWLHLCFNLFSKQNERWVSWYCGRRLWDSPKERGTNKLCNSPTAVSLGSKIMKVRMSGLLALLTALQQDSSNFSSLATSPQFQGPLRGPGPLDNYFFPPLRRSIGFKIPSACYVCGRWKDLCKTLAFVSWNNPLMVRRQSNKKAERTAGI